MAGDAVEFVRQGPRSVAGHGTARLWFHHELLEEDDISFGGEGTVEFGRLRFRIPDAAAEGGLYYWRGSARRGGWECRGEAEGPLEPLSPFWLIELVRGAVSASELTTAGETREGVCGHVASQMHQRTRLSRVPVIKPAREPAAC